MVTELLLPFQELNRKHTIYTLNVTFHFNSGAQRRFFFLSCRSLLEKEKFEIDLMVSFSFFKKI